MSVTVITFLAILAPSFAVFLLATRPVAASKVTRKRLVTIGESMRAHAAGVDGSELEKATPWGSSAWVDGLMERFRFTKNLKTLLLHANSNVGLGGVAFASVLRG